ncbi:putative uncharacterized protein [Bacteroides sp. CAG:702]|nr:putative uncharacterized protein [Bacteroides sp. CAG:702]
MTIKVLNRKNFFNSDVIKLVYWNEPNFGDILSPYMVEKLSGKKIVYKSYNISGLNIIKKLIKLILVFDFKKISSILFPWEKNLLAIGSILSHGNKHSIVWGSGFISEDESFNGGKILAVRGKYTNDKLIKMGFQGTSIYGDPALLIPILVNPVSCKTDLIGIIPHWSEVDYFLDRYNNKYKIIDFRTREVENTIAQITSCQYILSTSLHGLIVSHAYGIPALWIKKRTLHADDIKFKDYLSSVNIQVYEGFKNIEEILSSNQNCLELFLQHKDKSLPNLDIKIIQRNLLNVAPFPIVNDFLYSFSS